MAARRAALAASVSGSSRTSRPAAPTTPCSRRSSTPSAPSTWIPSCFRRFLRSMEMDLSVAGYETWDDLLDYMDGSAAVIGEMMLPDPRAASDRRRASRRAPSGSRSSSRTSSVTSARTSTAAGCTSRARTSSASAPTRRRIVDDAWRGVDALRDRPLPRPVRRRRWRHRRPAAGIGALRRVPPAVLYSRILEQIERAGYDVFSCRARVPTRVRRAPRSGGARDPAGAMILAWRGARAAGGDVAPRTCPAAVRRCGRHAGARVSVVIPARNEAATLPALLESLKTLDPPAHEVIVVDDESDDSTARGRPRPRRPSRVERAPRPAGSGSRGRATPAPAAASGTHLLFLDADTRLAPPRWCAARGARPAGRPALGPAVPRPRRAATRVLGLLQRRRHDGQRRVRPRPPGGGGVRPVHAHRRRSTTTAPAGTGPCVTRSSRTSAWPNATPTAD